MRAVDIRAGAGWLRVKQPLCREGIAPRFGKDWRASLRLAAFPVRQPEVWRSGCLVHSRTPEPVQVVMDGRRSSSAIFKTKPQPVEPEPNAEFFE